MLKDYVYTQIKKLRNLIQFIIDYELTEELNIYIGDLDELDYYLFEIEKSLGEYNER